MRQFGKRLKIAMQGMGLTQQELAGLVGVSKSSISQYISGRVMPGADKLEALANAVGVRVEFLTGGGEDAPAESAKNVKITFVKACRCLGKSEDSIRKLMKGGCAFGYAVQGTGGRLNYIFFPGKFREVVGEEKYNAYFG